jgi:hypothetical protein
MTPHPSWPRRTILTITPLSAAPGRLTLTTSRAIQRRRSTLRGGHFSRVSHGNQAGFNGDYSGLTINKEDEAHPLWSDTRNVNPFPLNGVVHDEDVFTAAVALPEGP